MSKMARERSLNKTRMGMVSNSLLIRSWFVDYQSQYINARPEATRAIEK